MNENKIDLINYSKTAMQTIVKIVIALLFSHISVSEPVEEKKEEVVKAQITFIKQSNSCVSVDIAFDDQII